MGRWIAPGTHVDLVGGFRPDMREADDALLARAQVYVDTRAGAMAEAGDLTQPMAAGVIGPQAVLGELAELVTGRVSGRTDAHAITVFKSVGTAIEDLAAAELLLERADA
jgi:ornithine cyclodeaminase